MSVPRKIAVIGGGASGFFGALRAAEYAKDLNLPVDIRIFESSSEFLRKVKISGGGRCNVTHNIFQPRLFVENYPRGRRELLSPFQQFQAADTVQWFADRGVRLKAESDGRMFPSTDQSETVIQCFLQEAQRLGVQLLPRSSVKSLKQLDNSKIGIRWGEGDQYEADAVLLATGSMPVGYRLAKSFGHKITDLAPSLFTFKIQHPLLVNLAGTSFSSVMLSLELEGQKVFRQKGPLLITHWGLSGPALLKLSAWAAREMKKAKYQGKIRVNWLGADSREAVMSHLKDRLAQVPKSQLANVSIDGVTKRFWVQLVESVGISSSHKVSELSKKEMHLLVDPLWSSEFQIQGKSRYKDEFVECGGVDLKEIHFKTMESKLCKGLFFAGELMDIDGITGGFNFQNAWTSGWIAGTHMVSSARDSII